jgi:hypothetical protein
MDDAVDASNGLGEACSAHRVRSGEPCPVRAGHDAHLVSRRAQSGDCWDPELAGSSGDERDGQTFSLDRLDPLHWLELDKQTVALRRAAHAVRTWLGCAQGLGPRPTA